jgi:acyl carrier protein
MRRRRARPPVLEARIRAVVAVSLGVALDELTPDVSLTDELAADSLDVLEVGLALEREFAISLPEGELRNVRTFGELLATTAPLVSAARRAIAASSRAAPDAVPT